MPGFQWTVPPSEELGRGLRAYAAVLEASMLALMEVRGTEAQNWMRQNAPWTDRTGNARQGLHVDVDHPSKGIIRMVLAHGVGYGIWLELANQGNYAIVNPAIDEFGQRIRADLQRLIGR